MVDRTHAPRWRITRPAFVGPVVDVILVLPQRIRGWPCVASVQFAGAQAVLARDGAAAGTRDALASRRPTEASRNLGPPTKR
jgi:hypothetical protein